MEISEVKQLLGKIAGEFHPINTKDLKPAALPFIGKAGVWQYLWIIEEGEYAGQWAMGPYNWPQLPPFTWASECDIKLLS